MDAPHHIASATSSTITELDLSSCLYSSTIADKINAVPGLKTSAAFFTFLRANLVLPPSAMSSIPSTPNFKPQTHPISGLSATSPSPFCPAAALSASRDDAPPFRNPLDDIPPLSLGLLTTRPDHVDALRLIADSIAQQRQQAALTLIFHPLCVAALILALGLVHQWATLAQKDSGILIGVSSGVVMSYLLAIRYLASGYLAIAESLTLSYFAPEDIVLGTKFGDDLVGVLVLRLEPKSGGGGGGGTSHARTSSTSSLTSATTKRKDPLRGGRGVVRAWTTKLRLRGKGVGGEMLREAVRLARERCGRDAEVGFTRDHANGASVLPEMFNTVFRQSERRAAKALVAVRGEYRDGGKRRR